MLHKLISFDFMFTRVKDSIDFRSPSLKNNLYSRDIYPKILKQIPRSVFEVVNKVLNVTTALNNISVQFRPHASLHATSQHSLFVSYLVWSLVFSLKLNCFIILLVFYCHLPLVPINIRISVRNLVASLGTPFRQKLTFFETTSCKNFEDSYAQICWETG